MRISYTINGQDYTHQDSHDYVCDSWNRQVTTKRYSERVHGYFNDVTSNNHYISYSYNNSNYYTTYGVHATASDDYNTFSDHDSHKHEHVVWHNTHQDDCLHSYKDETFSTKSD